jgi:DMSO reductase anchor subunit
MMGLTLFHSILAAYLLTILLGTINHLPGLSICGHTNEAEIFLALISDLLMLIIMASNLHPAFQQDETMPHRSRILCTVMLASSPLFLLTPLAPTLFCQFGEVPSKGMHRAILSLLVLAGEALGGIIYFRRLEQVRIHQQIELALPGHSETALKL